MGFLGCPRGFPGPSVASLPDFHGLPKASLGSPGLRTSQGLPRASLGHPGPSRASLRLPEIPRAFTSDRRPPYPQFNAGEARFRWDWQSTCRLTES